MFNEIYHAPGYKKPVWLLDVDGVLNAETPKWPENPYSGMAIANTVSFKMRWSPTLIRKIKEFHASGRVEIRWATTWCDFIGSIESLMGLPQFKCESIPPNGINQKAKINAALSVIVAERPLIWSDDNAIPVKGQAGWDSRLKYPNAGRLYLVPDERHGLTSDHIDLVDKYLNMIEE